MYCKNGCGRRAVSAIWKLCHPCFKKSDSGKLVDRPPPIVTPPPSLPKPLPQRRKRRDSGPPRMPIPIKPNVRLGPYDSKAPPKEVGIPYDWHNEKHLTLKEVYQILHGAWGSNSGWTVAELAHRYHLHPSQVKTMLNLPQNWDILRKK